MSATRIKYDYSVLLGRIKELYGTQEEFANKLGIGRVSLSQRLNSKLEFSTKEMSKSVQLLEMDYLDIPRLFFQAETIEIDEDRKYSAVRQAEREDIPRIAEILTFAKRIEYRALRWNDLQIFQEVQVQKEMEELQKEQKLEELLVYDDGVLKGVLQRKFPNQKEVQLCELYVEPIFNNTGVAEMLLEYLLKEANEKDRKKVLVWISEENDMVQEFYKSFDFLKTKSSRKGQGTKKILYEKQIG